MSANNAVQNVTFTRIVSALSPIISIGVGSVVFSLCIRLGLNPLELVEEDLKLLKPALRDHYEKFWPGKMEGIEKQLQVM